MAPDPDSSPASAAALRAQAAEIDGVVTRLAAQGHYTGWGSWMFGVPNDPEALKRGAELLGEPLWREDEDPLRAELAKMMGFDASVRKLRQKADELKAEALRLELAAKYGDRPYPILACERCGAITGWAPGGSCLDCREREVIADNRRELPDIMASWQGWTDNVIREKTFAGVHEPTLVPPAVEELDAGLALSLKALFLPEAKRAKRSLAARAWKAVAPLGVAETEGAVYDVPVRYKQLSPTARYAGPSVELVRFGAIPYEWTGQHWQRRQELKQLDLPSPFPTTFAASERGLDEAFADFSALVAEGNAAAPASRTHIQAARGESVSAGPGETASGVVGGRPVTVSVDAGGHGRPSRASIDVG